MTTSEYIIKNNGKTIALTDSILEAQVFLRELTISYLKAGMEFNGEIEEKKVKRKTLQDFKNLVKLKQVRKH